MSDFDIASRAVPKENDGGSFSVLRSVPFLLVYVRLALTIAMLADATDGMTSSWFVPMLCMAVFLDTIDGALARRLGVVTKRLREADSTLDYVMAVVFVICCWLTRRSLITRIFPWLVLSLILTLVSFVPAIIKYGRLPPYHTYSARITGVFIFWMALELFALNRVSAFTTIALLGGFLNQLDRVAITFILPHPPDGDVKGFWHALQIRDGALQSCDFSSPCQCGTENQHYCKILRSSH